MIILDIDKPERCGKCPMHHDGNDYCKLAHDHTSFVRAKGCPIQTIKTGHWISFGVQGEVDGQIVQVFTCSECGAISIFRMTSGNIVNGDICPNCGARMESEER